MPSFAPLVTIIVGNYNYEKFVCAAVDSALSQTYANIEVIVVDDGSTDGSRALLEKYGKRVRLILKQNGGATTTLNTGWAEARGEIVMFLDADDFLLENAAETIIAAWRPEIVKVQFPLTVIDAEGHLKGFVPAATRPLGAAQIDRLVRRWGIYPTPPTSGNAYARRLLEEVLPLDTKRFPYGVDGALNAVAPLYGSVISLGVSHGFYRVHGSNLWAGAPLNAERFRAYIEMGREEGKFLREHAHKLNFQLSEADPLDHSLVFLERRLALKKLAPRSPSRGDDHVLRLFVEACRCASVYEPSLISAGATLTWFLTTALAPRKVALKLLSYRYAPRGRPELINRIARLLRRRSTRPDLMVQSHRLDITDLQ
jgi:glycosyltransferase involved in cell wall biosynthesis